MHILLIEDDQKAARLLARGLNEEGFEVTAVPSAEDASVQACNDSDLILLDWMLPGKDGIALCRELRDRGFSKPILMLTARGTVTDRVAGLNTGADDYLTKPFVFEELLARIHALLRRAERANRYMLKLGDLTVDPDTHVVHRSGMLLDLTPKEYAMLELLMRNVGEIVSRQQLAEHAWQADLIAIDNLIDVHMKNLRRKLDPPSLPPLIQTVRGKGFRLLRERSESA